MIPVLFTLIVVAPLLEIYVLLMAGSVLGALPVILLCLATAFLGGCIIRWQGFAAIANARRDLEQNRLPVVPAVDGVLLLVAAPFLMTPGFISDFTGFLLLVPPFRRMVARVILRKIKKRIDRGTTIVQVRRY